ncbi:MAG: PP2C family protein-serine/threonine phosphatase, partial [Gemmataceae bacterium]
VAGKGVPASLLMAKLSAECRYCMLTQPDAASAVKLLNESLIRGGIGDRFVTLALILLNPAEHQAIVVNAGHMNPVLYRPHLNYFEDLVTNAQSGIPLGIMSDFEYEALTFSFEPGDHFLIFTDGVTDATAADGSMFEMDGIRKSLFGDSLLGTPNHAHAIGDRLFSSVKKHLNGRVQNDDIAIVCVGRPYNSDAAATSSHQKLPAAPSSLNLPARDHPG